MKAHPMIALAASIGMSGLGLVHPARAWEPLRAHPRNPYVLEFRGEATVLRTFAQHYSSVVNAEFDFPPYLDVLQRDGMNLTRVFLVGFMETSAMPSPLAPTPENFLQPWRRSLSHGTAQDGLGKWDFSTWNEDYFNRLRAFVQACGDREIVTELTLFSTFYSDDHWRLSPFHPLNNVQGFGPANRYDAFRAVDPDLLAVQQAVVRRIVREVNGFDNLIFEIQNEPFWNEPSVKDAEEVAFHNSMLGVIRDEEAALERRHLVAHNFPRHADALSADFDIINEHYPVAPPNPAISGGEALLRDHYARGKVLALDETASPSPLETRIEAWMFLLGGGGIYNGLDIEHFIYSQDDESGDSELGRGFRRAVRNIGDYIANLHLVGLRRDFSWLAEGIPDGVGVQAMANPGQQYTAYFHHGKQGDFYFYDPIDVTDHSLSLVVNLEAGTWRVSWTRPSDLTLIHGEDLVHAGGPCSLATVIYQEDVALRIDRTGEGDITPPPRPDAVTALARADGSIALTWNPVQAGDLAGYRIYRAESPGVSIDDDHLLASLQPADVSFNDMSTVEGVTYHYVMTALDLSGNASEPGRETSATSQRRSLPFGGTPWPVPGVIQAEDFDTGGQGVAYNDLTPATGGGAYRDGESVDLEADPDAGNGFKAVDTQPGEWLNYSIHAAVPGAYVAELRVANDSMGGAVHIEIDGLDVTGLVLIPETGGMDAWQTLGLPAIALTEGDHVLRLHMDEAATGGVAGHFDWISLTAVPNVGPIANAGPDIDVVDLNGDGVEEVTLDADESAEGDSPIIAYDWLENGMVLASGVNPMLSLGIGEHAIELLVTDARGLQATDTVTVTVSARPFGNGGFENGYEGWKRSGNQTIGTVPGYQPHEGGRCVAFNDANRLPNAELSQVFATVPGRSYQLTFDLGVIAYNNYQQSVQVSVTDGAILVSETFTVTGPGAGRTTWAERSLTFTAAGAATTLVFRDRSTVSNAIDLLLDHVRIVPLVTRLLTVDSVPESGVAISLEPPDSGGMAGGITGFSRSYRDSTVVRLTAPAYAGGLRFQKWLKNGVDAGSNPVVSVAMDDDFGLTAVYVEHAPVIIVQPADTHSGIGGRATFRVTAEGSGVLAYQWRFNGQDLTGAGGPSHTIDPVGEWHAGTYDVIVSNAAGSVTSEPALLTVFTGGLVNASFEDGFDGWNFGGNLSVGGPPSYVAADGTRCVAFNDANRTPDGSLSQTFGTTPGQGYLLTFSMGVLAYNTNRQTLHVELAGSSLLAANSFSITGAGGGRTVWTENQLAFVADGPACTVTFRDRSTVSSSIDLLLDHVRISPRISHILMVDSQPNQGVSIAISPPDESGLADGVTGFGRSYPHASVVRVKAAAEIGSLRFKQWVIDGNDAGSNPEISVTMDADHSLTAAYVEGTPVTNDLVNGGFEAGYDGWSAGGNQTIGTSPGYQPAEGRRCVAFNTGNRPPNGTLSQTFATMAGRIYQLTFDLGVIAYNADPQRLQARLTGNSVLAEQTFIINGAGGGRTVWVEKQLAFTADSAACTLVFSDRSTVSSAIDLLLDDVRVERRDVAPSTIRQVATSWSLPPRVSPSISRVHDGFVIRLPAPQPGWYELQRSSDLSRWDPLSKVLVSEPEELEFHDNPPQERRMFYRIALPEN